MFKIKSLIRKFLFKFLNPRVVYITIVLLAKNNLYIEKTFLNSSFYDLLKSLKGYKRYSISTTGVLMLFYDNCVKKIPLGDVSKKSLKINFKNYNILKNSELKELVNYKLEKKDNYYEMEILNEFNKNFQNIDYFLEKFTKNKKKVKLKEIKQELFYNLSSIEKILNIKLPLDDDLELISSVMHGDLTQNNIMLNKKEDMVLIDLDRFTFFGIDGIDSLHFEIDKESKKIGISFFDYIKLYKLSDSNKTLIYLYLLYRVSQEYHENITLSTTYYKQILSIINDINKL